MLFSDAPSRDLPVASLVHNVVGWLPAEWQASIERESREWRARCPKCLQETSVWDLGGVRFKAAGHPFRQVRCRHCSNKFFGQLYRVSLDAANPPQTAAKSEAAEAGVKHASPYAARPATTPPASALESTGCRLWIDGAGCYLLLMESAVTVGSPSSGTDRPDIAIMAAISRQQVRIVRAGEGYTLAPVGSADGGKVWRGGEFVDIGGGVQLQLRTPNPLSQTSVLEVASSHRIEPRCDGVILFDQVCVLGPGGDAHIRNPLWPTSLILFRRGSELWCKAIAGLQRNGELVAADTRLGNGDVLTTEDLRLRLEMSCGS
jgi:hypothetical protein